MGQENYIRTYQLGQVKTIHPAIFMDDCYDSTFNYITSGTGGYGAAYASGAAHSLKNGIQFYTPAGAPAVGDIVTIEKWLWLPPTKLGRLQFLFMFPAATPNLSLYNYLAWYDGAIVALAGINIMRVNSAAHIYYWNDAGGWTELTTLLPNTSNKGWNKLDWSIDFAAPSYKRICMNHTVVDLTGTPPQSAASAFLPQLRLIFSLEANQAAQAKAFLDHILLTPENP
jgi:hypothetical protein